MLTETQEAIVAPKGYVVADKLLVLPDPEITHTEEGIELPAQSRIRQRTGTIVVCNGEDGFEAGVRVSWIYQAPASVVIDGVEYHLMTPEEIAFIFTETREVV